MRYFGIGEDSRCFDCATSVLALSLLTTGTLWLGLTCGNHGANSALPKARGEILASEVNPTKYSAFQRPENEVIVRAPSLPFLQGYSAVLERENFLPKPISQVISNFLS